MSAALGAGMQARIFLPWERWSDEGCLLREIVRPLAEKLSWFWFSNYYVPDGADEEDCEFGSVPSRCRREGCTKSLRFRFSSSEPAKDELLRLVRHFGYWCPEVRAYNPLTDHSWTAEICSEQMVRVCHEVSKFVLLHLDETEFHYRMRRMEHLVINIAGLRDWRSSVYAMVTNDMRREG